MKRIAIIMPSLLPMPPSKGGAVETLVENLLKCNETQKQAEFTVYARSDKLSEQMEKEYTSARFVHINVPDPVTWMCGIVKRGIGKVFKIRIPSDFFYIHKVCSSLRGKKYDAVVCENNAAYVLPLVRTDSGNVYLHMHNEIPFYEVNCPECVAPACTKIISVSGYIRDWMSAHLGAKPDQNTVLLNCIDVRRFQQADGRDEVRRKLSIGNEEFVFLYAGRVRPEKGVLELLCAFREANIPHSKLIVVGSSWFSNNREDEYMQKLHKVVESIPTQVCFTGYVPYNEIPKYYRAADVGVFPSIWDEPGALTVLEAQASGLPVITTNAGGMADNVSRDGAIRLERGDDLVQRLAVTMRELAADLHRCNTMKQAALEWSEGRTTEHYYRNFLQLLE